MPNVQEFFKNTLTIYFERDPTQTGILNRPRGPDAEKHRKFATSSGPKAKRIVAFGCIYPVVTFSDSGSLRLASRRQRLSHALTIRRRREQPLGDLAHPRFVGLGINGGFGRRSWRPRVRSGFSRSRHIFNPSCPRSTC